MRRRLGEDGQASLELVGMLPLLLFAAMAVWQLHLIASASNSASSAARTGSRVMSLGGDWKKATSLSLPHSMRDGAKITAAGQKVTVDADVPILLPGFTTGLFKVDGSAELPSEALP